MNRRHSRLVRHIYLTRRQERGNYMVITALLLTVLIGMLALVVDMGFAAGQRRFMQNGADAATLAAARMLAESVSPYPAGGGRSGFPHFFGVTDKTVYDEAHLIASKNQNAGVSGRTTNFTVVVEYCVAANDNSYAPDVPGCTGRWVTSTDSDASSPPDGTYKVRVTVSSTITSIFGGVIGHSDTVTSGQSIAVIEGVCPQTVATGNIWPFTLWDQQDFGTDPNQLFELWGSKNPPEPNGADSQWKNVLDLSPSTAWCDGQPDDYPWAADSSMAGMVLAGTKCTRVTPNFTGTDNTWNRDGYAPDPRGGCYTGTSSNPTDLGTWASATFQGTLAVGMKMPLFPKPGDGGSNVSGGIYGPPLGPLNACSGTYFFNGVTAIDPAHPTWGVYRDVVVFTFNIPTGVGGHFYNLNTKQWSDNSQGNNKMGRATLIRILHFRIYSNYDGSASRVWGRVVSPVFPPDYNPSGCPAFGSMGPGIYGNVVRLGA